MIWFKVHVLNPLVMSFIAVLGISVYTYLELNNIMISFLIMLLGSIFLFRWINFYYIHQSIIKSIILYIDQLSITDLLLDSWEINISKVLKEETDKKTIYKTLISAENVIFSLKFSIESGSLSVDKLKKYVESYRNAFLYKNIFLIYDPGMFDEVVYKSHKTVKDKLFNIENKLSLEINKLEDENE